MISAMFFTLVTASILASFAMALKTQKKASYHISLYALANSINDQVCGTGFDEVDECAQRGAAGQKLVVAINDPASGSQRPVPITLTQRIPLDGKTTLPCPGIGTVTMPSLKIDYTLHSGTSGSGSFTMQNLATSSSSTRYSEVPGLHVTVTARKPAGMSGAYLVTTTAEYTDPFGKIGTVRASRLVSNVSGYANVN